MEGRGKVKASSGSVNGGERDGRAAATVVEEVMVVVGPRQPHRMVEGGP